MLDIKIGCDPELFMKKRGWVRSAHGVIPGTKEAPHKVDKGAVQVDGMALEFNIDPATSPEEFADNIKSVMSTLAEMVPDYKLEASPVELFSAAHLKEQPEEALELGCDPDFNAWEGGKANPTPDGETNMRTGSGHIHIGWTEGMDINDPGHMEACILLAKQLDYYLAIPMMQYEDNREAEIERRKLYGRAGCFRPKPYGMEYRTLSNTWLKSEELIKWVYEQTNVAVQELVKGNCVEKRLGYSYVDELVNDGVSQYNFGRVISRHIKEIIGFKFVNAPV